MSDLLREAEEHPEYVQAMQFVRALRAEGGD